MSACRVEYDFIRNRNRESLFKKKKKKQGSKLIKTELNLVAR